jgi:bifunctional non-homologous end joining protein LigD
MPTDARPAARERVTLYSRRGGSDKVYQVAIEPEASGFVVTFAYGRRGGTLATGAKTAVPVAYEVARRLYDKLVKEKTAKGYAPGAAAAPYEQTDKADRVTGVLPQLLNPVDEADVDRLLADDAWWLQEKFDGRRTLIRKDGDRVVGVNRSGLAVDLPAPVAAAVRLLDTAACLLDGEAVGDAFIAFDLLQEANLDLRPHPYHERYAHLLDLVDATASDAIRYAGAAIDTSAKQAMLGRLRGEEKEGVVFKRKDAPYAPGRPNRGGPQLQLKFCATASCLVAGANRSRRSVRLELLDGTASAAGTRVGVGNVTIPANHAIPAKGDVVELCYLYAYRGGSLYQPVYLGKRDDVAIDACTTAQLKFKAVADDDAEGDEFAGA